MTTFDDQAILESSAFDTVRRELLAIRMLDERFAEWVDGFRLQKGKLPKGANPSIPSLAQLETNLHEVFGDDFVNAFLLKLVDMTTASWEEYLGAFDQYYADNGDGLVPKKHVTDSGLPLGDWVSNQREFKAANSHQLTPEREKKLNSRPYWEWNALLAAWNIGLR